MGEGGSEYAARLARELLEQERFAEAEAAYRLAIVDAPRDVELYLGLAEALAHRDQRQAERVLRKAIRLVPDRAELHNALGCILTSPARSEDCFRRAAEIDSEAVEYRFNLALSMLHQGRLAEAEVSLRESAAMAPSDRRVAAALGELLLDLERYSEAVDVFETVLADVVIDGVHHREAWARYEHHDFAAADALFAELASTEDDEGYAWLHHGLGRALAGQEQWMAAARAHRIAVRLCPADAEMHQALGDALEAQRLSLKAAAAHTRAAQLRERDG